MLGDTGVSPKAREPVRRHSRSAQGGCTGRGLFHRAGCSGQEGEGLWDVRGQRDKGGQMCTQLGGFLRRN